jgi:hypothetical protein
VTLSRLGTLDSQSGQVRRRLSESQDHTSRMLTNTMIMTRREMPGTSPHEVNQSHIPMSLGSLQLQHVSGWPILKPHH